MKLLEPIQVGAKRFRNRMVVTPHMYSYTVYGADAELAMDQYLGYLERRVRGGVGMFGVVPILVPPVDDRHPFPYDHIVERLARIADTAHRHGAVAVVQTMHPGAKAAGDYNAALPFDGEPLWAFDAIQSDLSAEVAHAMEPHEVEAIVEGWGRVCEVVREAGLDGVEIHAGHGYLVHQSMAPWGNRRDDEWGEPLAFIKALVARCRRALGEDLLLGARMSCDDMRDPRDGGLTIEQLCATAVELSGPGDLDYINPSVGSHAVDYSRAIGTYRHPHGDFLASTARIKAAVGDRAKVFGLGRLTSPDDAEAALQRGDCDLVGMTRALMADPDIPQKLARGEGARIRRCVGANQGCIDRNAQGKPAMCFLNPDVGREFRQAPLDPVDHARRVLVVGAGPAGLKAAEIAARRGHDVVLAERDTRIGGRLGSITDATSAAELVESTAWIGRELEFLGVDVRTGIEVEEPLLADGFDAIVLATGSRPSPVPFSTDGSVPVLTSEQAMQLVRDRSTEPVMVHDALGTEEAAIVYEQLASQGAAVTVVTPLPTIGALLGWTHAGDHVPRLLQLGVAVHERTTIVDVTAGQVTIRSGLDGRETASAPSRIIHVASRRPDTALVVAARATGAEVHVVGDASAPRNAMLAFAEADAVARKL